ncbi:MATE family efflux transporter [Clostridium sp.]|uniref:MATE family efflux transporter n=1 Tax=Clostridium sp. TaxID=1506 RepID=UPI002A9106D3|nr:MATE family efflux transporter [Clostridium sp.]MDY6013091.1 MATE family efflux transporter [Clostridium sp.]
MKNVDLTKGNVTKVLIALTLPVMGSSFLQFAYNLIDMFWVGGLGSDAVASVGSASFYTGLGYSINSLVVIGTGIKVSHVIGEMDSEGIKKYINAGIFINLLIGIVYILANLLFGKVFINFLGINNSYVEREAYLYLLISAPMMFFAFFNSVYTRVFGSFGNNKSALKINSIGIILNIILDPLFIYVMKLGVLGVGIATLISNIIVFLLFRLNSNGLFNFDFKVGVDKKYSLEIVRLGFPMAFQRVLFTLVNIIIAKIIAIFGSDAIAAQKIGVQIESITYMAIGGLNSAVASFVGQNFGAKKYDRINQGYKSALKLGMIYAFLISIIFILFPSYLVKIFISSEKTILIASRYLQIIGFVQIFSAIEMISNGLFSGIGMPKIPSTISIIFTVFRIPMALVFIKYIGVNGIWLSIALSSMLKGIIAYLVYRIKYLETFKLS